LIKSYREQSTTRKLIRTYFHLFLIKKVNRKDKKKEGTRNFLVAYVGTNLTAAKATLAMPKNMPKAVNPKLNNQSNAI
jgi:hypothetical protein